MPWRLTKGKMVKQMKILICNERFLFRFGVDRVLLLLGSYWRKAGHEIIMMGNRMDEQAAKRYSDRVIRIPEAADYLHGNDFTLEYLEKHWNRWFTAEDKPDIAFIAGWPFYRCIAFLREKCGYAVFHDYGAVPMDGMSEPQMITQKELRRLRKENLRMADRVIAISSFIESSQSRPDTDHTIPTSYVHLGADHMDMAVWQQEESGIRSRDVLTEIKKLKEQGYRLILQPGRWETGNYKNSAAGFQIARILKKNGFRIKMLVLSERQDMEVIPQDVEDCYYCMGHIDDLTLKTVMECVDVGFSPTLWEGFDLPLAEMQYLYQHMYVYDLGAHPEVAAHPFFLCGNEKEAAEKICQELAGELPVEETELHQSLENFHQKFSWKKCAHTILRQMQKDMVLSGVLFIDVTNACHDTANSGVMRVTRKIARQMQKKMETVFVIWDEGMHKYVFPYEKETDLLCAYGGADKKYIRYRSVEGEPRTCMDEALCRFDGRSKFLLLTETVEHDRMHCIINYAHRFHILISAVFHDAIPVLRPDLCSGTIHQNHVKYMMELAFCDMVFPTAGHNESDLRKYWKEQGIRGTFVKTVELAGEMDDAARNRTKITQRADKCRILFVSTLEPRKNHKRFLRAFTELMDEQVRLKKSVSLTMVGNRYAGNTEIPAFVEDVCSRYANIEWLGVVDDAKLRRLYRECVFTVYPSEIEGYGMPVMESLWFGKPCLCSNSGSLGGLGAAGGCCLTDILDVEQIKGSLLRMITDEAYVVGLQNEAVKRKIITWDAYADGMIEGLGEITGRDARWENTYFSHSLIRQIEKYIKEKNAEDRIIVCSNFYPPGFIGGAEIIAHGQSRIIANDEKVFLIVFSMDLSETYCDGYCHAGMYDGVLIVRFCVSGSHMNPSGISFFHREMNEAFRQLCGLVNPTVVHGHNMTGMSLGMLETAKDFGAAVCMTLHDHWGFCLKNTILDNDHKLCDHFWQCNACMPVLNAGDIHIPVNIRQGYFRKVFEKVDTFLSPSRYLADAYIRGGFSWHRMRQLWNGIDTKKYANMRKKQSEKFRIAFVGHFGEHKGIELLIRAAARLKRKNIEIELAGDGEEYDNYRHLAVELGVLSQIRFWGKLNNSDMIRVFAETDVYCLPSVWPENQPVSITEAMACGIPVIASDLGGNRELVRHGINGFLFRPGDDQDLAEKIRTLMDDESLQKSFGDAGKKMIRRYDISNQASELLNIYRSIEKQTIHSKPFVSIKGSILPASIAEVTDERILLLDWIVLPQDYAVMKACVVLEGERPDREQMKQLKDYKVRMIVPEAETGIWNEMGFCAQGYESRIHLLKILSEFV